MKRLILPAFILLSVSLFTSCRERVITGSGPSKTEQRSLTGYYSKVEIEAPIDANIQVLPGATASLQLSGYANILSEIRTEIKDSTLHIYINKITHIDVDKKIQAQIILPFLDELTLSGSSQGNVKGVITGDYFNLEVAGSGDVTIDSLNVAKMDASLAGSTSLNIKGGKSEDVSYDMAGSSEVHAFGLQTTNSDVSIAGSATIELSATTKLDVDIAGSGEVKYKGHPALTQDIAGSGDLTDAN